MTNLSVLKTYHNIRRTLPVLLCKMVCYLTEWWNLMKTHKMMHTFYSISMQRTNFSLVWTIYYSQNHTFNKHYGMKKSSLQFTWKSITASLKIWKLNNTTNTNTLLDGNTLKILRFPSKVFLFLKKNPLLENLMKKIYGSLTQFTNIIITKYATCRLTKPHFLYWCINLVTSKKEKKVATLQQ